MSSLLEIKNLNMVRGTESVLEDVYLTIAEQQITGLAGPNGGGKTSLFEILAGFYPSQNGEILWSRPVEISYLPQQVLPKKVLPMTVGDFVQMGSWGPAKKTQAALSFSDAMETFELGRFEHKLLSEISGGQWRRALLARAFIQPADLYLLDEPFNQLDLQMENRVGELLRHSTQQLGKTFFIISHDWHAMDHYFDRLYLLNRKMITQGSVREVSDFYMNWKNPEHHARLHHS